MLYEYNGMETGWGQYVELDTEGDMSGMRKKEKKAKKEYLKNEYYIYMEEGLNINEISESEVENMYEEYTSISRWYYYIGMCVYYYMGM